MADVNKILSELEDKGKDGAGVKFDDIKSAIMPMVNEYTEMGAKSKAAEEKITQLETNLSQMTGVMDLVKEQMGLEGDDIKAAIEKKKASQKEKETANMSETQKMQAQLEEVMNELKAQKQETTAAKLKAGKEETKNLINKAMSDLNVIDSEKADSLNLIMIDSRVDDAGKTVFGADGKSVEEYTKTFFEARPNKINSGQSGGSGGGGGNGEGGNKEITSPGPFQNHLSDAVNAQVNAWQTEG